MNVRRLQKSQLSDKMLEFSKVKGVAVPSTGWVKAVRLALGITMQQLSKKLNMSRQSLMQLEKREQDGSITLKKLRETATALDMDLVYGFVPKDGSLDSLIDKRARELATRIVLRTSNTMKLEDQENSKERITKAIEERSQLLKDEMPKMLWD